jgi:hypothetical protein
MGFIAFGTARYFLHELLVWDAGVLIGTNTNGMTIQRLTIPRPSGLVHPDAQPGSLSPTPLLGGVLMLGIWSRDRSCASDEDHGLAST